MKLQNYVAVRTGYRLRSYRPPRFRPRWTRRCDLQIDGDGDTVILQNGTEALPNDV
jgi:hypothetical protein